MAAFDPDQFLAETEQGFDPDAFLQATAPPNPMSQAAMEAVKAVGATAMSPVTLANTLSEDPKRLYQKAGPFLPAAGAFVGGAAGPLGVPIGAGLGEITRQMAGIAFNDPNSPRTPTEAATSAMAQTALAGAQVVNKIGATALPFAKSRALTAGKVAVPEPAPYVDRAVGAVGDALRPIGEGIKKGVARMTEVMTGVPKRNAIKLIEQPSRLYKGVGQTDKLGKAVGEAEATSVARIDPVRRAKLTTNEKGVADKTVSRLLEKKYTPNSQITPEEAAEGVLAVDRTFPVYTQKNAPVIREYSDLRGQLSDLLGIADPKLAAAKSAYHDAMVGGSFRNLFRQTKTGQTSAVPFLSFLMSPSKWSGGEVAMQAAKLPFFSPLAYGTGIALGSTAAKVAGMAVANATPRQALISSYIVGREGQ